MGAQRGEEDNMGTVTVEDLSLALQCHAAHRR